MRIFNPATLKIVKFIIRHPRRFLFITRVKNSKLTYLGLGALVDLAERVLIAEKRQLPGIIIEAGCALGGSALVIATAKGSTRNFRIYDTFEQIPSPSSQDGEDAINRYQEIQSGKSSGIMGDRYYGYLGDLQNQVAGTFSDFGYPIGDHNINLIKGYFEDTLSIDSPVLLAHLDCDWYESVKTCLSRITPHLVVGGCLIIDDYLDWSGCKKAVDEFFATSKDNFRFEMKSRLHIIRVS